MSISLLSGTAWAVSGSALILAVLLLRAVLGRRGSAGVRYALWGMVLVRLLLPITLFSLPVPAGMTDWLDLQPADAVQTSPADGLQQGQHPSGVVDFQGADVPGNPADSVLIPEQSSGTVPEENAPASAPSDGLDVPWGTVLLWVWRIGTVLGAVWLVGVHIRFSMDLRRRRKVLDCPDCALPVYVVEGIPSPCLYGLIRPAIYLIPAVAEDPVALRHVLAHECAHARHGDHIWNLARCTALVLHWWNPLVWAAVSCSRTDGELACDATAIRLLGEQDRAAYGRTVLQVAAEPQPVLQIVSTMGGGKRELKERFTRITAPPRTAMALCLAAVLFVAFLAGCSFGNPSVSDANSPSQTPNNTEPPAVAPTQAVPAVFPEMQELSEGVLGIAEPVSADLNHNGVPETVQVLYLENSEAWAVSASEEGRLLYSKSAELYPGEQEALFLCTVGGEDYLLRYQVSSSLSTYWNYAVFSVDGDSEKLLDTIELRFDDDLTPQYHIPFQPAAGAVFL